MKATDPDSNNIVDVAVGVVTDGDGREAAGGLLFPVRAGQHGSAGDQWFNGGIPANPEHT